MSRLPRSPRSAAYLAVTLSLILSSCSGPSLEEEAASLEAALNQWLRYQYPNGHAPRPSSGRIETSPPDPFAPRIALSSGQVLESQLSIGVPATSFCMSFGAPEDGWCIPVSDPSVTQTDSLVEGWTTLGLAVQMPPMLCGNLSQVCHDIQCYEFAETSSGTFTRANVALLAALCGNCNEPSCQGLIDGCSSYCVFDTDCPVGNSCVQGACVENDGGICQSDLDCPAGSSCVQGTCVQTGDLHFSLTWSSLSDLDIYVMTPSGATISYSNRSADGGTLDVDDLSGEGGGVENVYFLGPLPGTYSVWGNLYSGEPVSFSVFAEAGGQVLLSTSASISQVGADSQVWNVSYP